MEVDVPEESPMHRLRVGDVVTYTDESEWPPVQMEGKIIKFENEQYSYLSVDFGKHGILVLTEDEVNRVA